MQTIRVFYPDYYPSVFSNCNRFPTLHVSPSCLYPGTLVEIIHALAKEANLTIVSLTAEDFGYSRRELDDIGPVLYNLLENGTIDLVAQPLQITDTRLRRFAFTDPIYQAQNRVIRRSRRNQYEHIWSFFETYDQTTWIAFAVAWILQLAFCLLTQRYEAQLRKTKPPNPLESAFQILRIQLLQPYDQIAPFRTKAGQFSLFFFSLVQCSILLGVFSSFVLANIINENVRHTKDTMNTIIDELRTGRSYVAATNPQKWIFDVINTSNDYPFLEIREAIKTNPIRVRPQIKEVIDLVINDNGMLFNQDDDRSYFYSMRHCELVAVADSMPRKDAHLMVNKHNSKLLRLLNKAIENSKVIIPRIVKKYWDRVQAQIHCGDGNKYRPLKLIPYTGLFLVCVCIAGSALVVLIIEMLSKCGRLRKVVMCS